MLGVITVVGPDRCGYCSFHIPTQGHRIACDRPLESAEPIYHMSPADQALAVKLGNARQTANTKARIKEARKDRKTSQPEKIHVEGATGEIGFGRRYGLSLDLTTTPRRNTLDYTIAGQRLDIKATILPCGRLISSTKKKVGDVDIYVHTILRDLNPDFSAATVAFIGWAWSTELICNASIQDLRGTPTYVLEDCDLHPISELESRLELARIKQ